jgi:hypothetical protein
MKRRLFFATLAAAGLVLLVSSCVFVNGDGDHNYSNYPYFESKLRGTWERDTVYTPPGGPAETVKGQLTIDSDTITINPAGTIECMKNIAKGVSLDGQSKDGKILIKQGSWQTVASYEVFSASTSTVKILELSKGDTVEHFKRIGD